VKALNIIGGIDYLSNLLGILKISCKLCPVGPPGFYGKWILFAPDIFQLIKLF